MKIKCKQLETNASLLYLQAQGAAIAISMLYPCNSNLQDLCVIHS